MWSDNETNVDLINVQHIVGAVTGLIENQALLPLTIGVFGAWGSGKSSVMKMTEDYFNDNEKVLCVSFNGWLFEGNDDAKSALMGSILDALEDHLPTATKAKKKAQDLLQKLLKRVDWLRLMGMAGKQVLSFTLTGMPHIGSLGEAAGYIKEKVKGVSVEDAKELVKESPEPADNIRRTVREFRQDFAELLKESKIDTLVVLIDDLDRCLPDTIIETLEAIKLFLYVPNTAFIIGADERLVQHAVKRRFPEIGDDASSSAQEKFDLGRDYLEKLVQMPVRIPQLGYVEVETYINLLFAQLRLDAGLFNKVCKQVLQEVQAEVSSTAVFSLTTIGQFVTDAPADLLDDLALSQQTADVLTRILRGNPRQIKRFLNTMLLRISMAKAKHATLKLRVMTKLMLLEEFKPMTFGLLAKWQAEADGQPPEIAELEKRLRESNGALSAAPKPAAEAAAPAADIEAPDHNPIPERARGWADDEWLRDWIQSEPPLSQENLAPYFYVARDKLGVLRGAALRLSEEATKTLRMLLSASAAERTGGSNSAAKLSDEEAAILLKALADRSGRSEDLGIDGSPLRAIIEVAKVKASVAGEALAFIETINVKRLPVGIPVQIQSLSTIVPAAKLAADSMLQRWSTNTENPQLMLSAGRVISGNAVLKRSSNNPSRS